MNQHAGHRANGFNRAIGPDGLSRLRLGTAVSGEKQKGVHDHAQIAANIVALYDERWLERELGRTFHPRRFLASMRERILAILEEGESRAA